MRSTFMRTIGLGSLIMAGSLMLPTSAAAAPSLRFYVPNIGGRCLDMTAPPDASLSLVWKDSEGTIKETASIRTSEFGMGNYCSTTVVVAVGDRLKISDGQVTHKLVIPKLTGRLNRVTDVMRGTASPNSRVRAECGQPPFATPEPCQWSRNLTADNAGNWNLKIPWDITGGWTMYAHWRNAAGDDVYLDITAPWFEVFLGQARFAGATDAGATARVVLQDSSHGDIGAGTALAGPEGSFSGQTVSTGQLVMVAAGDLASSDIASDAHFVVPNIDATATAADDRVVGQCEVNATSDGGFSIELFRHGLRRGHVEDWSSDGTFDINFRDALNVDVQPGDKVFVKCDQRQGDVVVKVIIAQ